MSLAAWILSFETPKRHESIAVRSRFGNVRQPEVVAGNDVPKLVLAEPQHELVLLFELLVDDRLVRPAGVRRLVDIRLSRPVIHSNDRRIGNRRDRGQAHRASRNIGSDSHLLRLRPLLPEHSQRNLHGNYWPLVVTVARD
jgi:hypothetical protein